MGTIESIISKLSSYLYTIKRDTIKGWYTIEIGIPISWTYKSTKDVVCEEIVKTEKMTLIQISPTNADVSIDDIINFSVKIVENNKLIEKKRDEFEKQMNEIKEKLAEEYEKFDAEIENIEDTLFDETLNKPEVNLEESSVEK